MIIQAYLPRQLTGEEAKDIIHDLIRQSGTSSPNDFARIMGMTMKELKGKTNGKTAQELVKQKLGV